MFFKRKPTHQVLNDLLSLPWEIFLVILASLDARSIIHLSWSCRTYFYLRQKMINEGYRYNERLVIMMRSEPVPRTLISGTTSLFPSKEYDMYRTPPFWFCVNASNPVPIPNGVRCLQIRGLRYVKDTFDDQTAHMCHHTNMPWLRNAILNSTGVDYIEMFPDMDTNPNCSDLTWKYNCLPLAFCNLTSLVIHGKTAISNIAAILDVPILDLQVSSKVSHFTLDRKFNKPTHNVRHN